MKFSKWLAKKLDPETAMRSSALLRSLYQFTSAGMPVLSENLMTYIKEGYQKNNDVFTVVNWLGTQAAAIPLVVQEKVNDEWVKATSTNGKNLQSLLDKPNPYQTGKQQRLQVYGYYNVTGNSFSYAPRLEAGVNKGQALEMWIMPSQYTNIISGGWTNPINNYTLQYGDKTKDLSFEDVLHIKTANLDFGQGRELWGMSPLRAGLLTIDKGNANMTAGASSFKNKGLNGIISTEDGEFVGALQDEQQEAAEKRMDDRYNGVINWGKTMVTNQKVTYTQLGLSPVDLNLLRDAEANFDDICNLYGLSSTIFNNNSSSSTYNNVKEAEKAAYNNAVLPLVQSYVEGLNDWLAPSYGDNIRILADTSDIGVLQADLKTMSEWLVQDVRDGIISRNEARRYMGLPPVDNTMMDEFTVNAGTMPITGINFDPFVE